MRTRKKLEIKLVCDEDKDSLFETIPVILKVRKLKIDKEFKHTPEMCISVNAFVKNGKIISLNRSMDNNQLFISYDKEYFKIDIRNLVETVLNHSVSYTFNKTKSELCFK